VSAELQVSMFVVVKICATLVNTQTHIQTHRHTAFDWLHY